jgi:predicted PurR-regulated permease PerM
VDSLAVLRGNSLGNRLINRVCADQALITVLLIVTIVLLPLTLTATSVAQEATSLYEKIEAGEIDFGRFLSQLLAAWPSWASHLLRGIGIADIDDLQARLSAALKGGSQSLPPKPLRLVRAPRAPRR